MNKQEKKEFRKNEKNLWQAARETALERDHYTCQVCGVKHLEKLNKNGNGIPLDIHHIINRECKELKYEITNLISLCKRCHRFSIKCSAHKNSFPFIMLLANTHKEQMTELWNKFIELSKD